MHEYRDCIDLLNYRGDIKSMPIGANLWPALKRFGESLMSVTIFLIIQQKIPATYMQTEEFVNEPMYYKVFFLIMSMQISIFYHYFVFGGWEANMIASGLSYRHAEKNPEFNSIRGVRCYLFSFSTSGSQAAFTWNVCTGTWLKYYLQLRLIDRTLPRHVVQVWPVAAVFVASSVWHGPEFGFACFFVTVFFNSTIEKFMSKTVIADRILKTVPYPILFFPLWTWNFFQLSFGGMSFTFKTLRKSNNMLAGFYYCLFWAQPLLLAIAIALPKVKPVKREPAHKVEDGDTKKVDEGNNK